ncbi:MAG: hypothetical protein E7374_03265 [Clostridiales bacterium]|nr:hypothetical protein [Clostridiales bacterium]
MTFEEAYELVKNDPNSIVSIPKDVPNYSELASLAVAIDPESLQHIDETRADNYVNLLYFVMRPRMKKEWERDFQNKYGVLTSEDWQDFTDNEIKMEINTLCRNYRTALLETLKSYGAKMATMVMLIIPDYKEFLTLRIECLRGNQNNLEN